MVNVNFHGFPDEAMYGPFIYHIHAKAVPADGNCTATLGHLDPTDRGECKSPTRPSTPSLKLTPQQTTPATLPPPQPAKSAISPASTATSPAPTG